MRYILILNILLSQFSYGQQCPGDSLFNRFKKDIQIELLRYKQIEWDDETGKSYYTLLNSCPNESLVKYVSDPIPAIRCLIFAGLAQKNASVDFLTEILSKHKTDTAKYIDSPTDVTITWSVRDFMQTTLDRVADKKLPAANYASRLATLKNKFRINIPGEQHGVVFKDSLLKIDSLTCSREGYKIVSFSLSNSMTTITASNFFTGPIKELIRSTGSGQLLYIDEIIGVDPNKRRIKLPSLVLEVK